MKHLVCLFFCMLCSAVLAQPNRDCRVLPPLLSKSGFDPKRMYLSTSERTIMGLVLMEMPANTKDKARSWQHPSWKNAGWLGGMAITDKGEIWVIPAPLINLLNNKPDDQNCLWKTHKVTGELTKAVVFPKPDSIFNGQNPYGAMGLAYDCDNGVIYASSVAGSTRKLELGHIYAVRTTDSKIIASMDSIDGFGLGVGTIDGAKRLYFGSARNGQIQSVGLNADGTFAGNIVNEFTLDDLGPRGDDRARKIRFASDGTMTVHGVEFYFNLTAPTEKQETVYQFKYNIAQKKWQLMGFQ
jgi:hypothetical protein